MSPSRTRSHCRGEDECAACPPASPATVQVSWPRHTQATVAVVHQEVSSQGPRREVIHTASPIGHVTHDHHFSLCEPVEGRTVGQGHRERGGRDPVLGGYLRAQLLSPYFSSSLGWQLPLLPTKSRRGTAATSPSLATAPGTVAARGPSFLCPGSGCRRDPNPQSSTHGVKTQMPPALTHPPRAVSTHIHAKVLTPTLRLRWA